MLPEVLIHVQMLRLEDSVVMQSIIVSSKANRNHSDVCLPKPCQVLLLLNDFVIVITITVVIGVNNYQNLPSPR